MELTRRQLLQSAGALALASAFGGVAQAQDYPSQDIRLICAFPADAVDGGLGHWSSGPTDCLSFLPLHPAAASRSRAATIAGRMHPW